MSIHRIHTKHTLWLKLKIIAQLCVWNNNNEIWNKTKKKIVFFCGKTKMLKNGFECRNFNTVAVQTKHQAIFSTVTHKQLTYQPGFYCSTSHIVQYFYRLALFFSVLIVLFLFCSRLSFHLAFAQLWYKALCDRCCYLEMRQQQQS